MGTAWEMVEIKSEWECGGSFEVYLRFRRDLMWFFELGNETVGVMLKGTSSSG